MLLPAVHSLLDSGNTVYLVARRPEVAGQHPNLHCISANWANTEDFRQKLQSSLLTNKPDRALLWIHTPYRQTMHSAISELLSLDAVIVDVRGSARERRIWSNTAEPLVDVWPWWSAGV